MTQEVHLVSLQQALSLNDPFAVTLVENFPSLLDMIDQDMRLASDVYQGLSADSHVDRVRVALAASARLQGIAMLFQSSTAYQQYTMFVEVITRWLYHLDMYLRTLPRY